MATLEQTETKELQLLIKELKTAASHEEIEKIEELKDDLIWSSVDEVVKDLWYETLGDAKKGLYF